MSLEKLTFVLSIINCIDHEPKRLRLANEITPDNLENIFEEALSFVDKQESKYKLSERIFV